MTPAEARQELARRELARRKQARQAVQPTQDYGDPVQSGGQYQVGTPPQEGYGEPIVNDQGQYQVGGDMSVNGIGALERLVSGIADQREALLATLSGTAASTAAPIVAYPQMAIADVKGAVTGQPVNPMIGPQTRDRVTEAMTYQPQTLGGQRIMEGQAELMQPVAEVVDKASLGDEALDAGAPEWVARQAEMIPEYIMALLTATGIKRPGVNKNAVRDNQVQYNPSKGGAAKFRLNEQGVVVTSKPGKDALSQGWDDVAVAGTKAGTPSTKAKIKEMVRTARERLNSNASAQDKIELRPSNVAGKSLHDRYKFIKEANSSAGKLLSKIAKDYKGQVDISQPVEWLKNELASKGVVVRPDGKLDFSLAKIPAQDFRLISENWRQMNIMLNEGRTFSTAHQLKQMMRRNGLSYGESVMKKGASPDAQNIYKGFSAKIDEVLDNLSPAYNKQNIKWGRTKEAMSAVEKIAKDSLFTESPESNLGTLTKRMMGNPVSRQAVIHYSKQLDDIAKEYGGKFDDDLFLQAYVANEMDEVIEIAAKTSLKGEAGVQAAIAQAEKSNIGRIADLYDRTVKFVGKKSPERALDALEALTGDLPKTATRTQRAMNYVDLKAGTGATGVTGSNALRDEYVTRR